MMQYKGRIDVRVEGNSFNLSYLRAGGTASKIQLSKANWLLSGDQEKHWFVEGDLDERWSQIYIEFISGGTGNMSIEFRGGWFDDFNINRHEVWLDDVELEGGAIINSSFEELNASKEILGWQGIEAYSDEKIKSRTGKRCVLIWHDEPAVQKIPVVAGKRYKVGAWFRPNVI